MFVANSWYVAGWSYEFAAGQPSGRIIIEKPIVLYRQRDGAIVALEDRCPHRWAPLSQGRIEGDGLRCMYHGLKFTSDGRCVGSGGGAAPPKDVCVRSYPVIELDNWVWVWMGQPELADIALIPRAFGLHGKEWKLRSGQMDYDAHYQLIHDNLCDLAHLDFVHETTLGAATRAVWSNNRPTITQMDRGLRFEHWFSGTPADPALGLPVIDSCSVYHFTFPGVFVMTTSIYEPGTAALAPEERAKARPLRVHAEQQALTPISAARTRYFYATGGPATPELTEEVLDQTFGLLSLTFEEDRRMIEGQQRIWSLTHAETPKCYLPNDRGPAMMRRIVERLLAREAANVPPVGGTLSDPPIGIRKHLNHLLAS